MTTADIVGRTARGIADAVRAGELSPVEVVDAHLAQIDRVDGRVGAFRTLRADAARGEAKQLADRADLGDLPLAGVPVAIKDNTAVAGESERHGCAAWPDAPVREDHELVRRLRDAGAVVLGITRMPELGLWGTTEGSRNPWDLDRTPGGSSGGSAAAVSAAMVPVAHGNDGLGSIRIPSACCGLVGIKPGRGVVPSGEGRNDWFGMEEHGPLATTVDDLALTLATMAGRPDLADVREPRPLRIGVSLTSTIPTVAVDRDWKRASVHSGRALEQLGHRVEHAPFPWPLVKLLPAFLRWYAAALGDLDALDPADLQPRTRTHLAAGRLAAPFVSEDQVDAARAAVEPYFADHDVLITPTLATPPPRADGWEHRSWAANILANTNYAPMAGPWNLVRYPAMAVPAGLHPDGTPLSVQLVSRPGQEATLLAVAKQLEAVRPWRRHAPLAAGADA